MKRNAWRVSLVFTFLLALLYLVLPNGSSIESLSFIAAAVATSAGIAWWLAFLGGFAIIPPAVLALDIRERTVESAALLRERPCST